MREPEEDVAEAMQSVPQPESLRAEEAAVLSILRTRIEGLTAPKKGAASPSLQTTKAGHPVSDRTSPEQPRAA
jgi:hypothetical protein